MANNKQLSSKEDKKKHNKHRIRVKVKVVKKVLRLNIKKFFRTKFDKSFEAVCLKFMKSFKMFD